MELLDEELPPRLPPRVKAEKDEAAETRPAPNPLDGTNGCLASSSTWGSSSVWKRPGFRLSVKEVSSSWMSPGRTTGGRLTRPRVLIRPDAGSWRCDLSSSMGSLASTLVLDLLSWSGRNLSLDLKSSFDLSNLLLFTCALAMLAATINTNNGRCSRAIFEFVGDNYALQKGGIK